MKEREGESRGERDGVRERMRGGEKVGDSREIRRVRVGERE